ncbi:MAG: hypothetical protein IIU55_03895 [Paludibacteraceae bacterium]|nr:hypothetical protein [Paludibacteraceae bacterium]
MKKSIFLFFAAILCAMTANAQWALMGTLTDWSSGKAMTVSGSTATCTVDLPGKTTYTLKVKNGSTWYGRNNTTISATTTTSTFSTSGGDVTLNTNIPGTYTFSFNTSTKKLTVTYPTAPAPHDITVRAQVPAHWTNDIYAHVWTSENASGSDVGPLTKEGDYYVVTKNAGALYVIFKNGSAWSDKNQTVDLCYTEDVCLQINQSGSTKGTATVIDCGAVAKDITVKAVVPGAWENEITAWVWPTGGEGEEVTPTKDGNWYVITKNCIELNVIFKNGTGWNGDENQTVNIEGVSENACYQISALNKVGGKCSVTEVDCEAAIEPEAKPEPTPTFDYYVIGTINNWGLKDANFGMTDENADGVYEKEVTLAAGVNELKVNNGTWNDGCHWGFSDLAVAYDETADASGNIKVTLDAEKTITVKFDKNEKKITLEGLTEKAPDPIFDYYIVGSFNGDNPKKAENGMTLDGTVYKATVTLADGDHTLKVTNGTWEKTWGYTELGAAYEEVSNPNDGYNNIKITLAAEKEITVIFDATAGKITFDGLTPYVAPLTYTVTVPAGTEKCYIAGDMNGWNFQEMTATANANEFTIEIAGARETDGYKYACQASWDYVEKKEDGNDLDANRTWTANDVVAKWATPPTYTIVGATAITGANWDPANAENLMTKDGEAYTLTKTGLQLEAGDYEYKVAKNGAWGDGAYPAEGNQKVTIDENGVYTIVYTYTVGTSLTAVPEKTGEYTPAQAVYTVAGDAALCGTNWDPTDNTNNMTDKGDGTFTWAKTGVKITGTVGFKVVKNHDFGNGEYPAENWNIVPENYEGNAIYTVTITFTESSKDIAVTLTKTGDVPPAVITYVLMGVNGDWTNGIPMTVNPGNADEYVLTDQVIIKATDAIKVVTLTDGTATAWCGNVDAYSNATYTGGGEDNIVLEDGIYTFYFKKTANNISINQTGYARNVTNTYGTICLPYASASTSGATFFEVVGQGTEDGKPAVYLASVTELEAGVPYIFEKASTANQIKVVYTGNKANDPTDANGLIGNFTNETVVPAGNYILYSNAFIPADGTTNKVNAYRAYLNLSDVEGVKPTQTMPGRRYIGMSVQGENEATGVEDIFSTDAPVKVIENGQLIIIRDGVKYNVQGQKL